ncbi:hypothetical protein PVK06_019876 [Gossypium arboreum]|uniref:Uncharacterized protein n=1 Tax=Gossypium arboreum TaxID=29729 RepID=A0ABR0PL73_GOSAR|nr:hypothetical protein PVK06_019876 [Gossypium arboreum]
MLIRKLNYEIAFLQVCHANDVRTTITTAPWDRFFAIIEPTYMELTLEFCSTFLVQKVMTVHDEPGIITFRLGGLEGPNLSRLLRNLPRLTLRSPRYTGAILHTYTCWPDVSTGHLKHDTHEDD